MNPLREGGSENSYVVNHVVWGNASSVKYILVFQTGLNGSLTANYKINIKLYY